VEALRFEPRRDTPDPDVRVLSDEQLAEADALQPQPGSPDPGPHRARQAM
jgi:hypothetical protein